MSSVLKIILTFYRLMDKFRKCGNNSKIEIVKIMSSVLKIILTFYRLMDKFRNCGNNSKIEIVKIMSSNNKNLTFYWSSIHVTIRHLSSSSIFSRCRSGAKLDKNKYYFIKS